MRARDTGTPRTTQRVTDPEPELEDEGPEPARDDEIFAQLTAMVDSEGAPRPREPPLAQLEGLHSEGMLTDEEFAAAEEILAAKLLAAKKLRNTPAQHGRPAPAAEPEPDPEPDPEPQPGQDGEKLWRNPSARSRGAGPLDLAAWERRPEASHVLGEADFDISGPVPDLQQGSV